MILTEQNLWHKEISKMLDLKTRSSVLQYLFFFFLALFHNHVAFNFPIFHGKEKHELELKNAFT